MSEHNKQIILKFCEACRAEGLKPIRILRLMQLMRLTTVSIEKPLEKASRKDIQKYLAEVEQRNYSEWTKHGYKVALKKFYKWLDGGEEYPEQVSWIKATVKNNHKLLPEELLSEDDVKKLAQTADHPRDRALIMTLYEGGFRIGETDPMKVVAAGASFGTGKVSCIKNVGGSVTASAGFDRSCNLLCSGMCPSDTTCSLALPPPFEGQEGACEATGAPSSDRHRPAQSSGNRQNTGRCTNFASLFTLDPKDQPERCWSLRVQMNRWFPYVQRSALT